LATIKLVSKRHFNADPEFLFPPTNAAASTGAHHPPPRPSKPPTSGGLKTSESGGSTTANIPTASSQPQLLAALSAKDRTSTSISLTDPYGLDRDTEEIETENDDKIEVDGTGSEDRSDELRGALLNEILVDDGPDSVTRLQDKLEKLQQQYAMLAGDEPLDDIIATFEEENS